MRAIREIAFQAHFGDRRKRTLDQITKTDLVNAEMLVARQIKPTPLCYTDLSEFRLPPCFLKFETVNPTGSFKVRGAYHCISKLVQDSNDFDQVIAASTGNHGIGLAWSTRLMNKKLIVVAPIGIPKLKLDKLERFGARVLLQGRTLDEAIAWARNNLNYDRSIFVPSFNPEIILGHSTLGTELFKEHKNLHTVYVPIGVGSGAAGLAISRDFLSPDTHIVAVVPAACSSWATSFIERAPVSSLPTVTIADGLRTARPDADMWNFLFPKLSSIISVSEDEILSAIKICTEKYNIVPEGAGAVGFAGLLKRTRTNKPDGAVAAIICG